MPAAKSSGMVLTFAQRTLPSSSDFDGELFKAPVYFDGRQALIAPTFEGRERREDVHGHSLSSTSNGSYCAAIRSITGMILVSFSLVARARQVSFGVSITLKYVSHHSVDRR